MKLQLSDGRLITVHKDSFVELFDGVEVQIPTKVRPGDTWTVAVKPYVEPNLLTGVPLGDSVFISNDQRLLSEVKSNLVQTHRDTKETEGWFDLASKATYNHRSDKIAVHYNHIFLAKGRTLYWTDLDEVWNWYPRPRNEADFRAIEWETDNITAIIVINDTLFIHFPTAVYVCDYVGKPTIVRIIQRNEGHGAISQNAIVGHKNSQFYMGVDNFYQWSPVEGIIPIGEEIWKRLINPDITKVKAYVDRVNKEIHWVVGDSIWAFNYVERHWSRYSSNGVLGHISMPKTNALQLQTLLDESGSIIERDLNVSMYNLWCRADGLFKSFEAGDSLTKVVTREESYLTSDEQTYGDIFGEKDVDKIVVDGSYGVGMDGFRIDVSAKKYVSDPDEFKFLGDWKHERLFKQADGKKQSGRSLKYRYTVLDKIAKWDGSYLTEGHLFVEGLKPNVWNGTVKMDDSTLFRELHMGVWDGGTNYINGQMRLDIGRFLLYAWGERVMLPKPPIGEDK